MSPLVLEQLSHPLLDSLALVMCYAQLFPLGAAVAVAMIGVLSGRQPSRTTAVMGEVRRCESVMFEAERMTCTILDRLMIPLICTYPFVSVAAARRWRVPARAAIP